MGYRGPSAVGLLLAAMLFPLQVSADSAKLRATVASSSLSGLAPGEPRVSLEFLDAKQRLAAPDAGERAAAAGDLGKVGQAMRTDALGLLRNALRADKQPNVRAAAARALGRLGLRDAVADLIAALREPHADVRAAAAASLWALPDERAVEPLLARLADAHAPTREWSALALGVIGARRALPELVLRLGDHDRNVRLAAMRSLGRLGDPRAVPSIVAYVEVGGRDSEELEESVAAVAAMRSRAAVLALLSFLRAFENDAPRTAQVASALGQIGDASAVPALRKLAGPQLAPEVQRAAGKALKLLEGRLAASGGSVQGQG
jgi:HEAT repeat protein